MDENVFVSIAEAANQKLVIRSENAPVSIKPNNKKSTQITNRRPLATLAFCEVKSHLNLKKKDQCKVYVKKVSPKTESLPSSNGNKKLMKEKITVEGKEKEKVDYKTIKTLNKQENKENQNQPEQNKIVNSIAQKSEKVERAKKETQNLEKCENLLVDDEKVKKIEKVEEVIEKIEIDQENDKSKEQKIDQENKENNQTIETNLLSDEKLCLEIENKENICPDHVMTKTEKTLMSEDVLEAEEIDSYSDRYLFYQCPEYSQDIYKYLLKCQERYKPDPSYMTKQKEINVKMRSILIDWMVEVTEEYKMTSETLFLAVSFIDRFLSIMGISRQNFQLLGTTALFISSKYEEIYPPEITEFVYITDDAYTKHQVLGMEKVLLRVLKFDISAPTIHYFLRKYLIDLNLSQVIGILSEYICYLCIIETNPTLYYLPNDIAISAILLASYLCGQNLQNNIKIRNTLFSGFTDEQIKAEIARLKPLTETLQNILRAAKTCPQQAVYYKYSTERYFSVATIVVSNTPIHIF